MWGCLVHLLVPGLVSSAGGAFFVEHWPEAGLVPGRQYSLPVGGSGKSVGCGVGLDTLLGPGGSVAFWRGCCLLADHGSCWRLLVRGVGPPVLLRTSQWTRASL